MGTTNIEGGGSVLEVLNLADLLDVTATTGTGTTSVLSTSPTFTTSIITPLVQGSAAAAGTLTLTATSNTTAGPIIFNGKPALEFARFLATGQLCINSVTAVGTELLYVHRTSSGEVARFDSTSDADFTIKTALATGYASCNFHNNLDYRAALTLYGSTHATYPNVLTLSTVAGSAGKFCIGTSPGYGYLMFTDDFTKTRYDAADIVDFRSDANAYRYFIVQNATNGTASRVEAIVISDVAYVSFGATASTFTPVAGYVSSQQKASFVSGYGGNVFIIAAIGTQPMEFWTGASGSGSAKMTLLTGGALCISAAAAIGTELLYVAGAIRGTGTAWLGCPAAAPADATLTASQVTWSVNESTHNLTFKVKYADGTTVKSGTVALT